MTISRLLARPLLASMFLYGGVNAIRNAEGHGKKAEPVIDKLTELADKVAPQLPIPHDPVTLVRINGAAQLVAGAALATGHLPRTSSAVLAASLVPTTLAGHRFWEETDPAQRKAQTINFLKNVSMLGGLLLASVDTAGKPGVAWRARHAVKDAKREAKLAAAKVG
jgi:putative oxidoreductase